MIKRVFALCMSIFFTIMPVKWEPLPGHIRYNEACFYTAHNAYASQAYGYHYAQQQLTIENQLALGVRGFMLDTRVVDNTVKLCHKSAFVSRFISRGKEPMDFHTILTIFKKFLDDNPTEVISIFLETYVPQPESLVDEPFITAGLGDYIYTPESHTEWPTLDWMRQENKRLVIFNTQCQTGSCFNYWQEVVENQWGALHPGKARKERPESKKWAHKKRNLYLLNYFPMFNLSFDRSYESINTKGLASFLAQVIPTGLTSGANSHPLPTFLCMDYVNIGDGLEKVLHINKLRLQTTDIQDISRAPDLA